MLISDWFEKFDWVAGFGFGLVNLKGSCSLMLHFNLQIEKLVIVVMLLRSYFVSSIADYVKGQLIRVVSLAQVLLFKQAHLCRKELHRHKFGALFWVLLLEKHFVPGFG